MHKKKEKLTNYTIKLSKSDKEAIDSLVDRCRYTTRAQVLRALPVICHSQRKQMDKMRVELEALRKAEADLITIHGFFHRMIFESAPELDTLFKKPK